ncbi:MAG: hypothetical protein Q9163_005698 [Psora crenata]
MQLTKIFGLSLWVSAIAGFGEKQVLITYPDDTPRSDLDNYKNAIQAAGGEILHEYVIIKGFVVKASNQVLETIRTFEQKHIPMIEEDKTMTTQEHEI